MRKSRGFTLIELMITVAIVGILTAIAYPSYVTYVQDARRADAQGVLLEVAQRMERAFTANGSYLAGGNPAVANTKSPQDGNETFYNVVIAATATTFTVTATRAGAQAGDRCGNMTVNQVGVKTAAENDCW